MIYKNKALIFSVLILFFAMIAGSVTADTETNADDVSVFNKVQEMFVDKATLIKQETGSYVYSLTGNVKIVYNETEFQSDKIILDGETGDISTDKKLVIIKDDFRMEAGRLEGNVEEEYLYLEKNVSADKDELNINSDSLTYEGKKERAVFAGTPEIEYKDIDASGDKMVYNIKTNIIELEGNVTGENKDGKFSCNKLIINMDNENIFFEGDIRFSSHDEGDNK